MDSSVEVVIPVLNEEKVLSDSVRKLHEFLALNLSHHDWSIVIADNGSTDRTPEMTRWLSEKYSYVDYIRLEQTGRGRALRRAWLDGKADILAYMDVDLSTDLSVLPRLIEAVHSCDYDMAIGSRLTKGAQIIGRPIHREIISRSYSLLFRTMFHTNFMDAQCGFKVIRRKTARELVPLVQDMGWFFDTELLILAEKNGYRIKEIPVRWTDDPDSRVKIFKTAYEDLKGLVRLRFGGVDKQSESLCRIRSEDR